MDSFELLRVADVVVGVLADVSEETIVADGDETMVDAGAMQAPEQTGLQ